MPYEQLVELAQGAEAFRTLVNPDDPPFALPGETLEKIDAFATATGQPVPATAAQYVRCCFESLALAYRRTLQLLESTLQQQFDTIHIVGGGCQNRFLCQMTADATGRQVVAGPVEATAIGNGLVQAMGDGEIATLDALRQIVARTESPVIYQPAGDDCWQRHSRRFEQLVNINTQHGLPLS
jgi:rhamnulokinase